VYCCPPPLGMKFAGDGMQGEEFTRGDSVLLLEAPDARSPLYELL